MRGAPSFLRKLGGCSLMGAMVWVSSACGSDGASMEADGGAAAVADGGDTRDSAVLVSTDRPAEAGSRTEPSSLRDPEILDVLQTADSGQVSRAMMALFTANSADVASFAAQMFHVYQSHLSTLESVSDSLGEKPMPNALSLSLATTAAQEIAALRRTSGAAFDVRYLGGQVDGQRTLLSLIDERLMPSVKEESLRAVVENSRTMVADHLRAAEQMLTAVRDGNGASADGGLEAPPPR